MTLTKQERKILAMFVKYASSSTEESITNELTQGIEEPEDWDKWYDDFQAKCDGLVKKLEG